jgi:hypothetical protein
LILWKINPCCRWAVAALDSSWRAIDEIMILSYPEKREEFHLKWGCNEEWMIYKKMENGETLDRDLITEFLLASCPELTKLY